MAVNCTRSMLASVGARPMDNSLLTSSGDAAARAAASPDEVSKLLSIGRAPTDASIDRVQLTAMTVVAAGVMNSPDAYTLR